MTDSAPDWTWAWQWWGVLVAINVVNLAVGVFLLTRAYRHRDDQARSYRRLMATLGVIFLSVAMYRAVFVSAYLRQLSWFDSVLNSSLLIRCLAICAELSFAGLIAKSLMRMNADVPELLRGRSPMATFLQTKTPAILFFAILTANIFATAATITKVDVLFAIEETVWTIGFLGVIPMLLTSWRRLFAQKHTPMGPRQGSFRTLVVILTVFSVGYVLFQLGLNLPTIWGNALDQWHAANPDPAFQFGWQALHDAFFGVHSTRDLAAWGGAPFLIWYTGYFTLCGWIVLFLMHGPRLKAAPSES